MNELEAAQEVLPHLNGNYEVEHCYHYLNSSDYSP